MFSLELIRNTEGLGSTQYKKKNNHGKDTALKHQSACPLPGSSAQDQRPGLRAGREIHGEQSRHG